MNAVRVRPHRAATEPLFVQSHQLPLVCPYSYFSSLSFTYLSRTRPLTSIFAPTSIHGSPSASPNTCDRIRRRLLFAAAPMTIFPVHVLLGPTQLAPHNAVIRSL